MANTTRDKFLERIRKTEQEVHDLEARLREKKAYLQAFNDSLKLLPREEASSEVLKPGSYTSQAVDILKESGRPLHIKDIIVRMGLTPDKRTKTSLVGTLSAYVRKKEILKRTGPNTFGLLEWKGSSEEPPEGFGSEDNAPERTEKKKSLF